MFKSLRWRLQVWHAVVLLIVLSSFGAVVRNLHWQTRLQQVDSELHRGTNVVMSQFRRLLPRTSRKPRRPETPTTEPDAAAHSDQNVAARTDSPVNGTASPNENSTASNGSLDNEAQKEKAQHVDKTTTDEKTPAPEKPAFTARTTSTDWPRDRPFRDPGPLPAEFEQLFHGDEDSRLYFMIWGKDGELLHKSDSAPEIAYPSFHVGMDGLPIRKVRERRADHVYREVVASLALPRSPFDSSDRNLTRPPDMNVLVGRSMEKELAAHQQSGLWLLATGLVILAAGTLGGGWLSARAIRPITDMTAAAKAISAQNLTERINVKDAVSELGQLAQVLNGTFDRLQMAVERQRQFTADASHELRTPLSVISTHTELALSRPRSNEDYHATIVTCQRAAQKMKSLIDSLLLLARFDSGGITMNRAPLNLAPLVQEAVDLVEQLAAARGLQIECQTTSTPVLGDWDRLSQVVINLLTNAIRYNVDGGQIRLRTRIDGGMAVISVTDTGLGIAEDQLPRIFDRFYQVDKARTRAEGSCGLGLSICKTIVEAHGGTICAASQLNVGTTIEVRLPLAEVGQDFSERESDEASLESVVTRS